MARQFNTTSDEIRCSVGGSNIVFGTWAVICKMTGADSASRCFLSLYDTAAVQYRYLLRRTSGNLLSLIVNNGSSSSSSTFTVTIADDWVFVAVSKPTGAATPRMHKYVYGTNTWTHEAGTGSVANITTTSDELWIGTRIGTSEWIGADIAAAGVWAADHTDAQIESMAHSLSGWYQNQPAGLWLLDQDAVTQTVLDLSGGGANENNRTGTTLAANSAPFSYGDSPLEWSFLEDAAVPGRPPVRSLNVNQAAQRAAVR